MASKDNSKAQTKDDAALASTQTINVKEKTIIKPIQVEVTEEYIDDVKPVEDSKIEHLEYDRPNDEMLDSSAESKNSSEEEIETLDDLSDSRESSGVSDDVESQNATQDLSGDNPDEESLGTSDNDIDGADNGSFASNDETEMSSGGEENLSDIGESNGVSDDVESQNATQDLSEDNPDEESLGTSDNDTEGADNGSSASNDETEMSSGGEENLGDSGESNGVSDDGKSQNATQDLSEDNPDKEGLGKSDNDMGGADNVPPTSNDGTEMPPKGGPLNGNPADGLANPNGGLNNSNAGGLNQGGAGIQDGASPVPADSAGQSHDAIMGPDGELQKPSDDNQKTQEATMGEDGKMEKPSAGNKPAKEATMGPDGKMEKSSGKNRKTQNATMGEDGKFHKNKGNNNQDERFRRRNDQTKKSDDSSKDDGEGDDKDNNKGDSLKDDLEKEAAKKAAELALESVGVPEPAAKEIVKKADEQGILDKVVDQFKKKKKISFIISAMPFICYITVFLAFVIFIGAIALGLAGDDSGSSGTLDSSEVYSVVDTFYPVYGTSTCVILEEYNPSNHEYIVSRSDENGKVYSVTDGEIIYVNSKGIKLYDKYDFNTKKCMCNDKVCDNYNGSEVQLKFRYDDIDYVVTYSNLAKINVSVGDKVKKGDLIGTEGDTGCVSSKRLTFKVVSENGISYNTNELLQICSESSNYQYCGFQNVKIDLLDCDGNYIKKIEFYNYIKNKIYREYKNQIKNLEFMKVMSIVETTKTLRQANYQIGDNTISLNDCDYEELTIPDEDSKILDEVINKTINQVLTYNGEFISPKVSSTCSRGETDKNANSIYNELCINEAIKMSKDYEEVIRIYYPNYVLSKNYCNDYASKLRLYYLDNQKSEITDEYSDEFVVKYNNILESRIQIAKYGSRAATVEAARFLALGLKNKVPFVNGGKFFEKGINKYWYTEGLDSSGFVSWALLNGGAKINRDLNLRELISNNVVGSLKIDSEFYKYFDKIQVGDFAYKDSRIGIIIGKEEGKLYVAEASYEEGLIVTEIKSLGISDSNYTHIYFANDYYLETGNLTSMW